jgi:hypothetical protein
MSEATTRTVPFPWLVVTWLVTGVALAAANVLGRAPQLAPIFMVGSVATAAAVYHRGGALRAWADAIGLRALVALHAIRLPIGAVFLWEYAHGRLPASFAVRGGVGDIAVGIAAIVVLVAISAVARPRLLAMFSVLGLVDIVIVAATAMYLLFVAKEPLMTAALTSMSYALLPLVVVPVIITSHVLTLSRLWRSAIRVA